jgi:hypothetical protein
MEQAQATLAGYQASRSNTGTELLEDQLLKIKQRQSLHRIHPLAKALEFRSLNPEETIGDGVLQAAPDQ